MSPPDLVQVAEMQGVLGDTELWGSGESYVYERTCRSGYEQV